MRRCEATVSSHQAPIVRVNLCCYDRGVHGKEVEVRGRLAKGGGRAHKDCSSRRSGENRWLGWNSHLKQTFGFLVKRRRAKFGAFI